MNPQDSIDLGREAMKACLMVGGPVLLVSLLIALLMGIVQAMTQVQDQTVSFVPKLVGVLAMLGLCLPWLSDQLVEYGKQTWATPMTHFHVTASSSPVRSALAIQASYQRLSERSVTELPNHSNQLIETEPDETGPNEELSSPFQLPHYRFSRRSKENIDG